METSHKTLSENGIELPDLKAMRTHVGLTLPQLANKSNIDVSRVHEIEEGHSYPNMSELEKIFKALGYRLKIEIEPSHCNTNGRPADKVVSILKPLP